MPHFVSDKYTSFFKELAPNNSKDWFDINRERYLKDIKKPFEEIVNAVLEPLQKTGEIPFEMQVKECIFRINKDIRFSKDKQPYKLHCSAAISKEGKKDFIHPALYFEIGPEFLGVYSGIYNPEKEHLEKIRVYLSQHYSDFTSIISKKKFIETFGEVRGAKNKIAPKELKPFVVDCPYILNKQFYIVHQAAIERFEKTDVSSYILDKFKIAKDFNAFLSKAL